MEKIEFIHPVPRPLLKWAAAALVVIVVLSTAMGVWAMTAVSGVTGEIQSAQDQGAQIAAMDTTITEQDLLIQEQDGTITALTTENTELTNRNTALTGENAALIEENTALTDENTTLIAQNATMQQQLAAYEEKYGTEYFVVFKIRRDGLIEENILMTIPVHKEDYDRFQIGAEAASLEPYLSVPSDWMGVDWSITVHNKYQSQAEAV